MNKKEACLVDRIWEQQEKDNWLRLLCRGDHGAFARLIDKYKETVFLCCRRLGLSEDEVEDVASETFMAAYKALGRVEHLAVEYSVSQRNRPPAEESAGMAT